MAVCQVVRSSALFVLEFHRPHKISCWVSVPLTNGVRFGSTLTRIANANIERPKCIWQPSAATGPKCEGSWSNFSSSLPDSWSRRAFRRHNSTTSKVIKGPRNNQPLSGTQIRKPDPCSVTVEYHRGLPHITVPLPSRQERCKFSLRPITNTVGDFLNMLSLEDKGIDRAIITSLDNVRLASSNTIEMLMENDFKLIVNDKEYKVITPKQERVSKEEMQTLSDVRNLVSQLYEALNVTEHQATKERELAANLERARQELLPLEKKRMEAEAIADRRTNVLTWAGLGLMSVQFGILARLTWWEYSWDIMEPVTYFVTYGTAMACYAYFVLTRQEYLLPDVKDRQHLLYLHKRARSVGLDLNQYNSLKDQIAQLETDLSRLRDPLRLHLGPTVSSSSPTSTQHSSTSILSRTKMKESLASIIASKIRRNPTNTNENPNPGLK